MEQARFNMIEQQIRPAEVLDPMVLSTIAEVHREQFVPSAYRDLAFSDTHIPISESETMMSPIQEARLLQALNIQEKDSILEIGTGSGYLTALLARLGRHVTSVEIDQELSESASKKLESNGIRNVSLEVGDGSSGWTSNAPYDVIAVCGSLPLMCDEFKHLLKPGGRLFVVVGSKPAMSAKLITRVSDNQWSEEEMFETDIAPLQNAEKPTEFVF